MNSNDLDMFPEMKIDRLENDIASMRRALFARITNVEKELVATQAVRDGNTLDIIEIKRLLQDAYEKIA